MSVILHCYIFKYKFSVRIDGSFDRFHGPFIGVVGGGDFSQCLQHPIYTHEKLMEILLLNFDVPSK